MFKEQFWYHGLSEIVPFDRNIMQAVYVINIFLVATLKRVKKEVCEVNFNVLFNPVYPKYYDFNM